MIRRLQIWQHIDPSGAGIMRRNSLNSSAEFCVTESSNDVDDNDTNYEDIRKATPACRHISFSDDVNTVFIPTRSELHLYTHQLYWSRSDFRFFKREATKELQQVVVREGISPKDAIKLLYQPRMESSPTSTCTDSGYDENSDEEIDINDAKKCTLYSTTNNEILDSFGQYICKNIKKLIQLISTIFFFQNR